MDESDAILKAICDEWKKTATEQWMKFAFSCSSESQIDKHKTARSFIYRASTEAKETRRMKNLLNLSGYEKALLLIFPHHHTHRHIFKIFDFSLMWKLEKRWQYHFAVSVVADDDDDEVYLQVYLWKLIINECRIPFHDASQKSTAVADWKV